MFQNSKINKINGNIFMNVEAVISFYKSSLHKASKEIFDRKLKPVRRSEIEPTVHLTD